MPEGSELEIKLAVTDARLFDQILADREIAGMAMHSQPNVRHFEAFYYDTPGFALQRNGYAYRIRQEGTEWISTLKSDSGSSGGLFEREEWNEKISGPEPAVRPFAGSHVGDRMVAVMGNEKLQLLFSTRFVRTVLLLRTVNDSEIELSMDRGTIWGGMDGSPISELELELKTGRTSDLLTLAGWISSRWHLLPEVKSKYERGMDLLHAGVAGKELLPLQQAPKDVSDFIPGLLINESITAIFATQLQLVAQKGRPEVIKDLRIRCRRTRSLLKFLLPLFHEDEGRIYIKNLRQWGASLGSVRDTDIVLRAWDQFASRYVPLFSASSCWLHPLRDRRSLLIEEILNRIQSGELTRDLFNLQAWFYQKREIFLAEKSVSASDGMLQKLLLQNAKALRDESRSIGVGLDYKKMHRFRIRVKQMRYVQEAFNGIAKFRADEFTAVLKKIQSQLGKIQDSYQIKNLLEEVEAGDDSQSFFLLKELLVNWRNGEVLDNYAKLPKTVEMFRKSAKIQLGFLTAMRAGRRTKTSQNTGSHEPGK